ncbi:MAG: DHH family phosphoesterase, partial [Myxococcota bacterium]
MTTVVPKSRADRAGRTDFGPGTAADLAEIAERLVAAEAVLICCHRGPDGDSVGSMIALATLLRAAGKKATLWSPDLIPRHLQWLPLARKFTRKLAAKARYSCTIVVDCADAKLLARPFPARAITGDLIVLDHHSTTQPFGELYLCDPSAASVGLMVARLARHCDWTLGAHAAMGIYVSLIADTGSFAYSNTTAEALELAAELVGGGVDPWHVHAMLHERATLSRYRLLSRALDTIELILDGKVAVMTITHELVKQAGANWDESRDLVNYTRALDGVECG